MKQLRKILGVTLLEVMLVLVIASMVIVMSIRYYQSASSSNQTNAVLSQIQGIIAAAENLTQATSSYIGIANAGLAPLLPANAFVAPWGGAITVTGATASTLRIVVANVPRGVCPPLNSKLKADNHITATPATCSTTGPTTMTYTYNAAA